MPLEARGVEHHVVVEVERRAAVANGLPARAGRRSSRSGSRVAGHVLAGVVAVADRVGAGREIDQARVPEDPEVLIADLGRQNLTSPAIGSGLQTWASSARHGELKLRRAGDGAHAAADRDIREECRRRRVRKPSSKLMRTSAPPEMMLVFGMKPTTPGDLETEAEALAKLQRIELQQRLRDSLLMTWRRWTRIDGALRAVLPVVRVARDAGVVGLDGQVEAAVAGGARRVHRGRRERKPVLADQPLERGVVRRAGVAGTGLKPAGRASLYRPTARSDRPLAGSWGRSANQTLERRIHGLRVRHGADAGD